MGLMDFLPTGVSGNVKIERFAVGPQEAALEMMRAIMSSNRGRAVPEGQYTRLFIGGRLMMSDTPDELEDIRPFTHAARGAVLINGLGLGCVTFKALSKESVDHAIVVEQNPDVIRLVAPTLQGIFRERLTVVEGDAFTYKPPADMRFDAVWHDIWFNMCLDNLPEMTRLKRKYARRADWQGCWGEVFLRQQARQEQRQRNSYR